jgi:hypothetical protein
LTPVDFMYVGVNGISDTWTAQWSECQQGSTSIALNGKGDVIRVCRPSERQIKFLKVSTAGQGEKKSIELMD